MSVLWSARTGGEASAAVHPGESPLDDPLTRLDLVALGLISPMICILNRKILFAATSRTTSSPRISTTTWRLMPSILLAPSKLRGPRTGHALIEQESITPAEGSGVAAAVRGMAARPGVGSDQQVRRRCPGGCSDSNVCSRLSRPPGTILGAMRHTTFRFALASTPAQVVMLARHAGASRFAYNQCLQLVTDALATKRTDPTGQGAVVGIRPDQCLQRLEA
jgi:Helix-turn-helix domain